MGLNIKGKAFAFGAFIGAIATAAGAAALIIIIGYPKS